MSSLYPSELSPRLRRLRDAVVVRQGSWVAGQCPCLLDLALWRGTRPGQSRVERRAALLLEVVRAAKLEIGADWRLAGEHLWPREHQGVGALTAPARDAVKAAYALTDAELEQMQQAARAWGGDGGLFPGGMPFVDVGQATPDFERGRGVWSTEPHRSKAYWGNGWIENHSVRDYAKVLRLGFNGIRAEIAGKLQGVDPADPELTAREPFWHAALSVCDAGVLLGRRYAEFAAAQLADASDPVERQRLAAMAEACARVPAEGARTFFEAVQALWFSHLLTCGEDGINANSIGRLDQILHPYYQADVAAGRLTRAAARELMEELACKMYLDYDVQAIVLGGVDRDGRCAVNDLSSLILEATRNVETIRDISIRVNSTTPPAFLEFAAELIAAGGGIPFMFNDDCFLPALTERGIALADARDYAPIGCIELTIPGKANPHAVSGWFNAAKCLELALFNGCDPRTGEVMGPPTGLLTDHGTFDALWAAYTAQVEFLGRRMVYHCNRGELMQRERGPLPCWSVLTDACIERGRDITNGGALYNYHSVCLLGTANAADSLMAVRQLVFAQKRVTASELLEALRANFAGREELRQLLLKQAPKYGNDCREVDELACRVAEHFIGFMDTLRSPLGGRYFVHLFSFLCNLHFGKSLGATPDGRLAGEPIAYSLSAQQGRDEQGATAMLNSLARLPHRQAAGATAAIIELDPKVVEGAAGVQRLAALMRTAVSMGVGQLQWNVVTAERLRQAQQDPERYGNLAVRVAGFSQKFRLVDRELQDHIIARTKHQR